MMSACIIGVRNSFRKTQALRAFDRVKPKPNSMKVSPKKLCSRAALAAGLMAVSIGSLQAATHLVDSFDNSASLGGWYYQAWNNSMGTISFSPTNDAQGNPSSGSMAMTTVFGPSSTTNGNGGAYRFPVNDLDASAYTALECDVKVDAASGLDQYGNAADFKLGVFTTSGYNYHAIDNNVGIVSTNNGWAHLVIPASMIGQTEWGDVKEVFIQLYDNNYTTMQTATIYVDNIKFTGPDPTYPNYTAFTFDNASTIVGSTTNWYGNPVYIEWSTNDAHGSATSGSLHVVANFAPNNNDIVVGLAFDTNWANFAYNTNFIDGTHYTNVEMDIMWDTNLSTVTVSNFNRVGDIGGFPLGLLTDESGGGGGQEEAFGSATTSLPDAATNGWVHVNFPLDVKHPNISQTIGIWLKKYVWDGGYDPNGTVAFYMDNIVFDGGPLAIPRPTMTISKPPRGGLNLVQSGQASNASYDREGLLTVDSDFSFVDSATPWTYSMNIISFPDTNHTGYAARIMLIPTSSGAESEPDWVEPNIMILNMAINAQGQAQAQIQCKTNSANGNGSPGLYDASDPTFTSSKILGNWVFTITQNTNVFILAPDGTSTNVYLPLALTSSDVETYFGGGSMVVNFGSINGGSGNEGQRCILASVGITNGTTSMLYDNFLTDTQLDIAAAGSGTWVIESDANNPAGSVFLGSSSTVYAIDWTTPANGFSLQTNNQVSGPGWATNPATVVQLLGDHFHVDWDETNVPPSGPFFWRLIH